MTLSRDKCQFRQSEVTYLGETLTQTGVKPDTSFRGQCLIRWNMSLSNKVSKEIRCSIISDCDLCLN